MNIQVENCIGNQIFYFIKNRKRYTSIKNLSIKIKVPQFSCCHYVCTVQGVPKKCGSDFSSHYWHKYFTHMKNSDRYEILIISAFQAIFCFYPTPFQSVAIVRQSTSPPKSNTLFWSTAYVYNACVMCWIQLSWKLRGWFIDKWGPLKQINKGVGSHTD